MKHVYYFIISLVLVFAIEEICPIFYQDHIGYGFTLGVLIVSISALIEAAAYLIRKMVT